MMLTHYWKRQTGIGLLELMLVLSIASVIILASVSYYQSVASNQKITQANAMIADIYSAAKNYVKSQGASQLSLENLIATGLLTQYFERNPWGGQITVATNGEYQIVITMDQIPIAQCQKLNRRMQQTFTNTDTPGVSQEASLCELNQHQFTIIYDLY